MTPDPLRPQNLLGTFTVRLCRAALLCYWPALALSTHWPNLNIQEPDIAGVGFDKWLHFGAFGLLTALIVGACFAGRRRSYLWNFAFGLLIASAYAPLDEWTQRFVEGRDASWADLRGDFVGIALGGAFTAVMFLASRRYFGEPMPPASNVEGDAAFPAPDETPAEADSPAAAHDHGAHSFIGGAMVVSLLTFISRITGLMRDSYLGGVLGLGGIADAYTIGFTTPNLFRRLFGEGALTAAFIPEYTDLIKKDPAMSRRFGSLCLGLTAIVLGAITILGELLLGILLATRHWPDETRLAIRLVMITLPYMPLVCLVALFGSMLQVHGRFAPSAGMPIFLNVVMIVGTWMGLHLGPYARSTDDALRFTTYAICISIVAAGVIQIFTQGAVLLRYFRFTTVWEGAKGPFRSMLKVFLPMFIALSVFQLNVTSDLMIGWCLSPKEAGVTAFHFAGRTITYPVSEGGIRAMYNATALYQFPLGVFGLAIATAIFPALAHATAEGNEAGMEKFRRTLRQGLRLTVFIGLPASVGLIMVRLPAIRVFYEHHKFRLSDSQRVASILLGFAPAIWAYSMTHVVTRAFYSLKDARTPLRVSLCMVPLNLALNLVLVWPLGIAGLAWSTCICAVLQNVLLLRKLSRRVERPIDSSVIRGWTHSALLTLLLAAVLWPILHFYDPTQYLARRGCVVELAAMVALGAMVFLGGAWVTGMEEMRWLRKRG